MKIQSLNRLCAQDNKAQLSAIAKTLYSNIMQITTDVVNQALVKSNKYSDTIYAMQSLKIYIDKSLQQAFNAKISFDYLEMIANRISYCEDEDRVILLNLDINKALNTYKNALKSQIIN